MSEDPINKNSQPQQLVFNSQVNIPFVYANGVAINMSASDLQLVLSINGKPVNIVSMAIPMAKTLLKTLSRAVEEYESKTGVTVLDANELSSLLKTPRT